LAQIIAGQKLKVKQKIQLEVPDSFYNTIYCEAAFL
jgi:hypothetical protein